MKMYKLLRRFGDGTLGSQMPELPFSIEYTRKGRVKSPIHEVFDPEEELQWYPNFNRRVQVPLLVYDDVYTYAGNNMTLEMWEVEPASDWFRVQKLVDTHTLQLLSPQQLVREWGKIMTAGEPSRGSIMRAPKGTIAVWELRLVRRLPRHPLPVTQLEEDEEGRHKYGDLTL